MAGFEKLLSDIRTGKIAGPLADERNMVTELHRTSRVKSRAAIKQCLAIGKCENPRCGNKTENPALHPHHVSRRGAGGADAMDNLVCLCVECHNLGHSAQLPDAALYAIIHNRKGKK